ATRLVSRVRSVLGVDLTVRALFEAPTAARLAEKLAEADKREPTASVRPALVPTQRPHPVPLSPAQQRLWFIDQMEGSSPFYTMPFAFRLSAEPDIQALRAALADVVARHESLRTVFPQTNGTPNQLIREPGEAHPDLMVTPVTTQELPSAVAAAAQRPFDLAADLPLRGELFAVAPDEWVLVLVVHHIACDGWSMGPLWRDLSVAYEARCAGRAPSWEPLPVQYADYALWQTELLGSESVPDSLINTQAAYWRTALAGLPEELALPLDRPRSPLPSHRGDGVEVAISAELHDALTTLAHDHQVSVFMVFQAAFACVLSRLGAGTDVPIGTPVAGRTDEQLDDLVGFFVNMLVLRTDLSGDPTFRDLLAQVRETNLSAHAHQDLPFDRLVDLLNPHRSTSCHPLFQVMLALDNTVETHLDLTGTTVTGYPVKTGVAKFDLALNLLEHHTPDGRPGGIDGVLQYAVELFDGESVGLVVERLVRVLEAVVADPGVR
ncbi:condensation domain-containing protein, partial [Streptomyces fagopyri]|uniref:condensation domain-containing protein n=1 Tax=Streptomyces fagopyri TaxID=2662397 RepID=UPI003828BA9B